MKHKHELGEYIGFIGICKTCKHSFVLSSFLEECLKLVTIDCHMLEIV